MKQNPCRYTVRKCSAPKPFESHNAYPEKFYGPVHGSDNTYLTLCGMETDSRHWWVLTNEFDGVITCKKCLNEIVGENEKNM